jgi:alkylated DNA repair dioxygenase AlkB
MAITARQQDFFQTSADLPEGFRYEPSFLSPVEEAELLERIRRLPLKAAQYKQFTAKRRTVSYGSEYDFNAGSLNVAPELPAFLLPLRDKAAHWLEVSPELLIHGLISEYCPGTPLGWHRDVPNFGRIFGVSLGGTCRMRLRPWRPGERQRRQDVIALEVAPRSAYEMTGPARWGWQHSIAPTRELRYSITFRTRRGTTVAEDKATG